MPNTPRNSWPTPEEGADPFFEAFEDLAKAIDASVYADRENAQVVLTGGGTITWDAGTDDLTWSGTIEIPSAMAGFLWRILASSAEIPDGSVFYAPLTHAPLSNTIITPVVGNQLPVNDANLLIAIRRGDTLYFRNGMLLNDGDSLELFDANPANTVPNPIIPESGSQGIVGALTVAGNEEDDTQIRHEDVDGLTEARLEVTASSVSLHVEDNNDAPANASNVGLTAGTVTVGVQEGVEESLTTFGATGTVFSRNVSTPTLTHPPSVVPVSAGGATTITWTDSLIQTHTLTESVTYTMADGVSGQVLQLFVTNPSTYTVSFPGVLWRGGVAPTQSTGNKTDVYAFTKIGATYYGTVAQDFA